MAKRVLSEEELIKDRLAYMGTLAGGLAHEVRSPLNSIHLNVELLERSGCHPESQDEEKKFNKRISRIKGEVDNLQKILTEFLQFARPPGVKRLATDVKDFLYDVVEFIDPELSESSVKVKFEIGEHDYPVLIDRRQMEQVLQNLIFNARDAMLEGGTIKIKTDEDLHQIHIQLEDDGPGIELDEQERVFDAFFTTKEHGTGLGLGICRRIVSEHQGTLLLESPIRQGQGTRFIISLPKEKLLAHPAEQVVPTSEDDVREIHVDDSVFEKES
jgi:signal transduction histidine kinase